NATPLLKTFVVEKPKGPVTPVIEFRNQHRAADRKAELVPLEVAALVREIVPGIEFRIAQKLVDGAVQLVRPALDRYVDVGARCRAVSSGHVGLNAKFLNCINRWIDGGSLEKRAVVESAIERVVGIIAAAARHGESLGIERFARSRSAPSGSGSQPDQVIEVAAVKRQLNYLRIFHRG